MSELVSILIPYGLATKNHNLIRLIPLVLIIINTVNKRVHVSLKYSVENKWKNICYKYFEEVDQNKKENTSVSSFKESMNGSAHAISSLMSWGIPTCFNTIGSFLSVLITLCVTGNWHLILIFSLVYYVFFKYGVKSLQEKIATYRKQLQEERRTMYSIEAWVIELLKYGKKDTTDVLEVSKEYYRLDEIFMQSWILVADSMSGTACILTFIGLYPIDDWETFLMLKVIFDDLKNTIESFSHFTNNLACKLKELESFVSLYSELGKRVKKESQLKINKSLHFSEVDISIGKFKLKHNNLSIKLDNNVTIVKGGFGTGKTTLIKALQGVIPGATLIISGKELSNLVDGKQPSLKNYTDALDYMSQHLRTKLTTLEISVRNLLDNEQDNALIMELVKVVGLDFRIKNENDIDIKLKGLSGGQQMLLALLYVVHQFIISRKQILVLDEPDQGLDPDSRLKIMSRLFKFLKSDIKKYNGNTNIHVFVILHGNQTDIIEFSLEKTISKVLELTTDGSCTSVVEYSNDMKNLKTYCK